MISGGVTVTLFGNIAMPVTDGDRRHLWTTCAEFSGTEERWELDRVARWGFLSQMSLRTLLLRPPHVWLTTIDQFMK